MDRDLKVKILSALCWTALAVYCVFAVFSLKPVLAQKKAAKASLEACRSQLAQVQAESDAEAERISALNTEIEELRAMPAETEQFKAEFFAAAKALEDKILAGETDLKIAYLTFDDGPYQKTAKFLDVLKEKDVQASFELICAGTEDMDDIYSRYLPEGHTVANHTYMHKIHKGLYSSKSAFAADVQKDHDFVKEKLGIDMNIFRFPGGSGAAGSNKQVCIDALHEMGYGYVQWNCTIGDGGSEKIHTVEKYTSNVLDRTKDQKILVVLMHDYSQTTLESLPGIIDGLRDMGYVLLPLFPESCMVM